MIVQLRLGRGSGAGANAGTGSGSGLLHTLSMTLDGGGDSSSLFRAKPPLFRSTGVLVFGSVLALAEGEGGLEDDGGEEVDDCASSTSPSSKSDSSVAPWLLISSSCMSLSILSSSELKSLL